MTCVTQQCDVLHAVGIILSSWWYAAVQLQVPKDFRDFQKAEEYGKLFIDIGLLPAAECERLQKQRATMMQTGSAGKAKPVKAKTNDHAWQMPWYLAEKLQLDTPALLQALGQGVLGKFAIVADVCTVD